jgi:hypothetical protein
MKHLFIFLFSILLSSCSKEPLGGCITCKVYKKFAKYPTQPYAITTQSICAEIHGDLFDKCVDSKDDDTIYRPSNYTYYDCR